MIKNIFFILLIFSSINFAQPQYSASNGTAGAFSRMGFGTRGNAMANSISAVKEGNVYSYYNPALIVFQEDNALTAAYSFLSLDRQLNYLSFARKFVFYSAKDSSNPNRKPRSTAGVSAGLINASVNKIGEYDNQGYKKSEFSTSENQFFIAFANKFSEKISVGVGVKFYYYKLYEEVTSTGLGFDLGLLYSYNENLSFSFVFQDLNSKYKWDTSPIYGNEGMTTINTFPLTKKVGVSFKLPAENVLMSGEFLFDNYSKRMARFGVEYSPLQFLILRGGIDNLDFSNSDELIRPSFGFSYLHNLFEFAIAVEYAYVIEHYSPGDRHIIGINFKF